MIGPSDDDMRQMRAALATEFDGPVEDNELDIVYRRTTGLAAMARMWGWADPDVRAQLFDGVRALR